MEKKEKKLYEAPQLTVATFRTERGYAASRGVRLGSAWTVGLVSAWGSSLTPGTNDIGIAWTDQGQDAWIN